MGDQFEQTDRRTTYGFAAERQASLSLFGGYAFSRGVNAGFEVFNLLDAKESDIDYFYTSRLPGEPLAGVADIHTHPAESRTARLVLRYDF